MPTKSDLLCEIGAVLKRAGVSYSNAGARDKHYGVWLFSLVADEASNRGGAWLFGGSAGAAAKFRGKPGNLEWPPVYTAALVRGARRDWEVHVDVNILGASGAEHGVDVSLVPLNAINDARRRGSAPRLTGAGLGIEAKCFGNAQLSPNEGRIALGFHIEVGGTFWLVANKNNGTVDDMLSLPARRTMFFPDTRPGSPSETAIRQAVRAHLSR